MDMIKYCTVIGQEIVLLNMNRLPPRLSGSFMCNGPSPPTQCRPSVHPLIATMGFLADKDYSMSNCEHV